ncbi:MAG TPA: hypothetical protein PKV72_04580 [Candidatus Peribacteria bacterium]|nr:hypothetical protein [Candidatus Peribacteria bacterium]
MANELFPVQSGIGTLPRESEAARLVRELCEHPVVVRHSALLKTRILTRLIASEAEPNAIDWHTERGDFVFDGLRAKFQAALETRDVSLTPGSGAVLLEDRYVVANFCVSETSDYGYAARGGLFNTNMVRGHDRTVITPYRAVEGYVSPREVHGDEPHPAFELTEGEALAGEAELVIRSLLATRDCVIGNRADRRMDAVHAGMSDMIGIVDYIRGLLLRLDAFAGEEGALTDAASPLRLPR